LAVLLHGDFAADRGAGSTGARALPDLGSYRYFYAAVDGHYPADLDAIDHGYASAGRQCHLYQHAHQDDHTHTDCYLHTLADRHCNRHGNGYRHGDTDAYLDPEHHPVADQYSHLDPKRHGNGDRYTDPDTDAHGHADRHAHCHREHNAHRDFDDDYYLRRQPGCRRALGSEFEGRVKKRRRLRLELTERQQLDLVVILVVLLAASLLYCLGFASLALRQVWEKIPVPWTRPEPLEEELTPAPEITSTLPLTPTTGPVMTPTLPLTTTSGPVITSTLPLEPTTGPVITPTLPLTPTTAPR